jgi:alanyl-tRNA synthetase
VLSQEIRREFLKFFEDRNHTIVSSSSIIPDRDPTLLFVNAGMVQFKNVFLGAEKRPYKRATTSQKCVRAGGKHNDLGNVGKTLRHHTFFEMLGNFSFGDYFKKDAIAFAWEFLLKKLKLDESRLWVTIFTEDDEAEALWKAVGVNPSRIVRLGEKDNFWSMGDEGPCGPCSEIIYDLGDQVGCRQPTCAVGCDCDRFLEIWNLVFMQYERFKDGQMKKLPNPNIDTGMGLERIVSVIQGKVGNYETDLFVPLIKRLEDISGQVYGEKELTDIAFRVIADHVRGAVFIIGDGVLPSKDGRGYVLRRILRRALRYGKKVGIEGDFLSDLSRQVVDMMGQVYPEVKSNYPFILQILKGEEERFLETLSVGMRLYDEVKRDVVSKGEKVIPGDVVYRLYDTFGFPVDITEEMAREGGLFADMRGFDKALDEQRERSRADRKMKKETFGQGGLPILNENLKNDFAGYDTLESDGTVIAITCDGESVDAVNTGEEAQIYFDTTPFYGESGGQVSDDGIITNGLSYGTISEVTRLRDNLFSHTVIVENGGFKVGDKVRLSVDRQKRTSIARNHTATHLLQFALRSVLGDHVKQSGSLVEKDRLRFDFTHFQAMKEDEIRRVEDMVNEKIVGMADVRTNVKSRDEAIREGATALFEEKYGDTVRVVSIGDFSRELCGGTHVKNTGEIGSLSIMSEGSLASGIRRIEAVTGSGALAYKRRIETTIKSAARELKTDWESLDSRLEAVMRDLEEKEKEIVRLKEQISRRQVDEAIKNAYVKDGVSIVTMFMADAIADDLRKATDIIRDKVKSCVIVIGTKDGSKGLLIAAVTKDLTGSFSAGQIIKSIASKFSGKGGGNPQMAQGGVGADQVEQALAFVKEIIG